MRGGDELAAQIHELKSREGTDIVLTGSISLTQQLLAMGIVDELRLFVFPVVVGIGRRLFTECNDLQNLTLHEHRSFADGVVLLRYAVQDVL